MKTAFIFSGQGVQKVGMGQDLCQEYPCANSLFEKANEVLGMDLRKLCWEGPIEELSRTENAQPAIYTLSVACLELLREAGVNADAVAGHSVGEYAALYMAGCFDFEKGVEILHVRGTLMREAAEANAGGMMAVMGLPVEKALQIASELPSDLCVDVAAFNSPQQLVLSGKEEDLKKAGEFIKEKGAKRAIPLKVAGAFHSRLQTEAREKMTEFMKSVDLKPPRIPYVANYTGKLESDPETIREMLCNQLTSPVRWLDTMGTLQDFGVSRYVECGGDVLSAFVRSFNAESSVCGVSDVATLQAAKV